MVYSAELDEFYPRTPALSRMCAHRGRRAGDTLRPNGPAGVASSVKFAGVVTESMGCAADRVGCRDHLQAKLDGEREVRGAGIDAAEPHGP